MKFWVAVTDNAWFDFLSPRNPDEVNFWQPRPRAPFTGLPEGTPFLFKLKSPNNHIAGGGFFVKYSNLPISLAWDAFGEKNGTDSLDGLQRAIFRLLRERPSPGAVEIGCAVLATPFFFPRERWIPLTDYKWSSNIVRGKTFDTQTEAGAALWQRVNAAMAEHVYIGGLHEMPEPAYGTPQLVRPRLGQGAFRVLVTDAYRRRCAITGENILPVLEAAHIKPFAKAGPSHTDNGLLLRSDFHKLFDLGLMTVTPNHRIEVSTRIRKEWYNGKAYYRLHGNPLAIIPDNVSERPRTEYLAWHNEHVFAE